jgi:anti-sigma regulatory factor (Ser/Thr protein kinase)
MDRRIKIIYLPSRIDRNNVPEVISKLEYIFQSSGKDIPNIFLNFENVRVLDITGVLVLYKFLEFSVNHRCFKNPQFNLTQNRVLENRIERYGFSTLIAKLMDNKTKEQYYKNLSTQVTEDFILAPVAMIKGEDSTTQKENALKKIVSYYGDNDKSTMILQIFSELFQNFISHAENDTLSVIVVHGNRNKIEIACADNGIGIIDSLKENPKYNQIKPQTLFNNVLKRGVTSKENSNHLGYGLYYVNEVVSRLKGQMAIYTDDMTLQNIHGKIKISRIARWQGTLINVNIPLTQSVTIDDIESYINTNIKINFL